MERLANAILGIIHPDLHQAGLAANVAYKDRTASCQPSNWTLAYSGMDVIVNQITPPHRDASGTSSSYDLLISLGKGYKAKLCVTDIWGAVRLPPWHPSLSFWEGLGAFSASMGGGRESCYCTLHEGSSP